MKLSNTEREFLSQILDEEHVIYSDLQPVNYETKKTGLSKREMILKNLVDAASNGSIAAAKLLFKINDDKL